MGAPDQAAKGWDMASKTKLASSPDLAAAPAQNAPALHAARSLEPAPILTIAGNPAPLGAQAFGLRGQKNVRFRALRMAPSYRPGDTNFRDPGKSLMAEPAAAGNSSPGKALTGTVILCPGRTEPVEKYFELLIALQQRGLSALALDWRGQGLADRLTPHAQLHHVDDFDHCVADLDHAVALLAGDLPRPFFLLCHSMGGAIGLRALEIAQTQFAAAAFSAPMWGVQGAPPPLAFIARMARTFGAAKSAPPGLSANWQKQPFAGNGLTSDEARYTRNERLFEEHEALRVGSPSFGWVANALDWLAVITRPAELQKIRLPILIGRALADRLVDNAAIARVAAQLPNATLVDFEGSQHEILQEVDVIRDGFLARMDLLFAQSARQSAN